MSNQEFENYIALIGKLLQLSNEQRAKISGELQDHLQMRVSDLMSEGVGQHEAVTQALEEFGDAAVMAKNFQSVINLKRRRWMMRFATFSIAAAFMAVVLTMALWPDNARFGAPDMTVAQDTKQSEEGESEKDKGAPALSMGTQQTMLAEQELEKLIDLNYEETPWSEIEEDLEIQMGLNILLSDSAGDDALTNDEPLSFNLDGIPAKKALWLMLVTKNATYVIDDGVIVIISIDDAEDVRWFRLKMFDCRELVEVLPKTIPSSVHAGAGGFGGGGVRDGGGGGVFSIASQGFASAAQASAQKPASSDKPSESQLLDQKLNKLLAMAKAEAKKNKPEPNAEHTLLDLVQTMIQPDSWTNNGQGLGQVDVVNGFLVVSQSEGVLQEIESFLTDLEGNILTTGKAGISAALVARKMQVRQRQEAAKKAGTEAQTEADGSDDDPFAK